MNLLCPNCQKMLTVPDQYAGQIMRCPLCQGTFPVPALPATPAPAVPPPPTTPSMPPETYAVKNDAASSKPAPAATASSASTPATPDASKQTSPVPELERRPPPPSAGHERTLTIWISPRVLQWVAPVALFLVFILTFLPWVGQYPGDFPVTTQNAWQAAFDSWTTDGDLAAAESAGEYVFVKPEKEREPGVNVLTIFYVLLLIPTLFLVVASAVLPFLSNHLPPAMRELMPWRYAIAGAVTLVTFLFLALQLATGFSIEKRAREYEAKQLEKAETDRREPSKFEKLKGAAFLDQFRWTNWLRLAVVLHFLAVVSLALELWLGIRRARPLPRINLQW